MIDFGVPCGGAEIANVIDHTPLTACDDLSGRISMAADDGVSDIDSADEPTSRACLQLRCSGQCLLAQRC